MASAPVWPSPVTKKLFGLNLPPKAEEAFVEEAIRKLANASSVSPSVVCFEAAVPDDQTNQIYEFYAWVSYTWQDGACIITDLDCTVLNS